MHIDHTHCMTRSWGKAKGLEGGRHGAMSLMFLLAKWFGLADFHQKFGGNTFSGCKISQPEGLRLHIPPGSEKRKDFNVINV